MESGASLWVPMQGLAHTHLQTQALLMGLHSGSYHWLGLGQGSREPGSPRCQEEGGKEC